MNLFYNSLPEREKNRVESLEVFDEFEEFELKCSHYTVLLATSSNLSHLPAAIFPSMQPQPCIPEASVHTLQPQTLSGGSGNISRYDVYASRISGSEQIVTPALCLRYCDQLCMVSTFHSL